MNHLKSGLNSREEANLCQVQLLFPKLADDPERSLDSNQTSLWQLWLKFARLKVLAVVGHWTVFALPHIWSCFKPSECFTQPRDLCQVFRRETTHEHWLERGRGKHSVGHSPNRPIGFLTFNSTSKILISFESVRTLKDWKPIRLGCFLKTALQEFRLKRCCSPADFSRLSEINNTTKIYWTTLLQTPIRNFWLILLRTSRLKQSHLPGRNSKGHWQEWSKPQHTESTEVPFVLFKRGWLSQTTWRTSSLFAHTDTLKKTSAQVFIKELNA